MQNLSENEVLQQSKQCYAQWCEQWRDHAKYHGARFPMHSFNDFHQTGIGRAALCVANGYSFEDSIETIKQYHGNVDVVACDKTIGHLIANGIKPKYCVVCDANVNYEKYLEPYRDQLQDTILISNVCANTKWATLGNWKDVYFFVNKDIIKSEIEFAELSGCPNTIVAGTNVSNAMVVILTQCDNEGARNFFGYDKILLIGFDYSWAKNYYAFDQDGGGKINYMRGSYLKNLAGEFAYTSPNLSFSARWFEQYVNTFKLPVIQCTTKTITALRQGNLADQMKYKYRPDDSHLVREKVKIREKLQEQLRQVSEQLEEIAFDHTMQVLKTC